MVVLLCLRSSALMNFPARFHQVAPQPCRVAVGYSESRCLRPQAGWRRRRRGLRDRNGQPDRQLAPIQSRRVGVLGAFSLASRITFGDAEIAAIEMLDFHAPGLGRSGKIWTPGAPAPWPGLGGPSRPPALATAAHKVRLGKLLRCQPLKCENRPPPARSVKRVGIVFPQFPRRPQQRPLPNHQQKAIGTDVTW